MVNPFRGKMNILLYLLYFFTWALVVGVAVFACAHLRKNRSRLRETRRIFNLTDVDEFIKGTKKLPDLYWWNEEVSEEQSSEQADLYHRFFRERFLPLSVQMIRQREIAGISSLVVVGALLLISPFIVFLGASPLSLTRKLVDLLPLIFLAVTLPFLVLRILKDYRKELLLLILIDVKLEKMLKQKEKSPEGEESGANE